MTKQNTVVRKSSKATINKKDALTKDVLAVLRKAENGRASMSRLAKELRPIGWQVPHYRDDLASQLVELGFTIREKREGKITVATWATA